MLHENQEKILAMYNVRGIQKYIYRTAKLKDAMGASDLVENIILDALTDACQGMEDCRKSLAWDNEDGPLPYEELDFMVQVLYIGGGNAFVIFRDKDLCLEVNRKMSRYIIEKTYSLQLAAAYVEVTGDFQEDYGNAFREMERVKSEMGESRPLGALPVMRAELSTGFPAIGSRQDGSGVDISLETQLKESAKKRKREEDDTDKILDSYACRDDNSRIAVVHIDGNNMGMRISGQMNGITDYGEAVNKIRKISYSIRNSYQKTFLEMKKKFENAKVPGFGAKRFVRHVIAAGDDITYVCNAYIALETVRYFCEKISGLTMNGKNDNVSKLQYGFSACAGIAYIGSHFPFNIGYEVAEACCSEAKKKAKSTERKAYYRMNMSSSECSEITYDMYKELQEALRNNGGNYTCFERIGNFVDFQICKNIQCRDLERIRREEFETPTGEQLCIRPYYIPTDTQYGLDKNEGGEDDYENLKKAVLYFSDENNIPRSMAKRLRNTYSLGRHQVLLLASFLDSRGKKMPKMPDESDSCTEAMYFERESGREPGSKSCARWYDALEIMDYSLFEAESEGGAQ